MVKTSVENELQMCLKTIYEAYTGSFISLMNFLLLLSKGCRVKFVPL